MSPTLFFFLRIDLAIWVLLWFHIGEGNGTPLQYSCLENPMDGGAWWAAVHGVAKSRTWLSNFTFTFHVPALEKEMAAHSSVLAWRIPGTGDPGGLPSMGSHRVGHVWSDLAAAAAEKKHFRKPGHQLKILALKVTRYLFCHVVLHKRKLQGRPTFKWRELYYDAGIGRYSSWIGHVWRLST